ncbi:hypothetical protein B0H16DRAFT_1746293 [Mycena metata]|nr:hypothetical protein B0H16DRAFT_1746293 [Mycena metata]
MDKTPADDPSWRKNGHQYNDVPPAVQTHVRGKLKLTLLLRGLYLPHPKLSVVNLVKFTHPPMADTIADYKIPIGHNFFSEDDNHSDLDLLTSEIIVPPPAIISALVSQARQRYLDGAESIILPWTGQLYPLSVLELWTELQVVVRPNMEAWAKGLKWLTDLESKGFRKEVEKTLKLLDTLAWTG